MAITTLGQDVAIRIEKLILAILRQGGDEHYVMKRREELGKAIDEMIGFKKERP